MYFLTRFFSVDFDRRAQIDKQSNKRWKVAAVEVVSARSADNRRDYGYIIYRDTLAHW